MSKAIRALRPNAAGGPRARAVLQSPLGKLRSVSTTPADRWATTASRSPGSRFGVLHRLPGSRDPVAYRCGRTAYSCGGSPGIEPEFPFNPREGNLSCVGTLPQIARRVNRRGSPRRRRGSPRHRCLPSNRCAPSSRGCNRGSIGSSRASDEGRTPAHGRDTAPPPAWPRGHAQSSRSASGSNSDTHPMPTPSARAASHMFWIAQATDARSISGIVRRPNTCLSRSGASPATRSSPQSRMPSTLRRMNSSSRSPSAAAVLERSSSTKGVDLLA
jgi:hypothetical protein